MARLEVFKSIDGEYLLDCQADMLDHLRTRFVVPLAPPDNGPKIAARLNPVFQIGGETLVMYTQFAMTVPVQDMEQLVTSLDDQHIAIMDALDMLITGY
jgi:toxin CcdB